MDLPHLVDAEQARIATAAGFGSFVFLMVTRNLGWLYVLALFLVGQISAYYFTIPFAHWRGWSPESYPMAGFTIGLFAMAFWSTVVKLAQGAHDDPFGTATSLLRLWRGGSGGKATRGNPGDGDAS